MSEPRSAAGPTRRIGPHSYRIEGDLFLWQPRGQVLAEHARGVVALIKEHYKRHGYVLYLLDGREGKPLGADTRRIVVDALRPMQGALALAAFGMGWAGRASGMLVFSAARLLTGLDFSVGFFSTEAEARAFLSQYRERRARASSSSAE